MVRIITQNVRGLQNMSKRRAVFNHLRNKAEIICLQETHCSQECSEQWSNEWGGSSYWSNFSTQARGSAILIKRNTEIEVLDSCSDIEGRIVLIQFMYKDEKCVLVNVYAPNKDDPTFWLEVLRLFERYEGKRILAGDFNLVMDPTLDKSTNLTKNLDKSAEILKNYSEDTFLTDIWRVRNPEVKQFSFITRNPFYGSRLDYILIDTSIQGWVTEVKMIPAFKTDHAAVLIELVPHGYSRGRGFWKLNTQILYELDYVKLINSCIDEAEKNVENLPPDQKWEAIKLNIIAHSQEYSRERAANRNLILNQLEDKIKKYDELEAKQELSELDQKLRKRTVSDFEQIMDQKTKGIMLRSGAQYFMEGEKPTKYFFQLEKYRSGAKGMSSLLKTNGEIITDPKVILQEQFSFYKKLYKSDENVTFDYVNTSNITLSDDQRESLEGTFTEQELKNALKNMKRNKCPGCDGLPPELYMLFYQRIKITLLEAFNYCYENDHLYKSALRGLISLIPKRGKDTRLVRNMRPITLLNTDYKLIEKILANRLRPVLEFIINEDQKGFMANRRIHCNIRRILDIMDSAEEQQLPGVILSLDFEKCFDRIEIKSLLAAMDYFKFGPSYQKWIKMIYTDPIAAVVNNGNFSPYFEVSRSVKQGGPNSAYLFLILAEILALELRKNRKVQGILLDIDKTLGQYADDMDLYLLATQQCLQATMQTIDHFEKRSGFKVNYDKTTMYRIGSIKDSNCMFYTAKQLTWTNYGINVLGVDICYDVQIMLSRNYEHLVQKAQAIMKQWGHRSLSLLAKILVVNTLIASLFVYKMSVLPIIPNQYIDKLNMMIQNFLWNGKKPKISMKVLQTNKYQGGAGLVNFLNKDLALKASWVQIINTDSILQNMVYKKLNPTLAEDIWNVNIAPKDVRKLFPSHFWTDVLFAWATYSFEEIISDDRIFSQIIWYNSQIRCENKPIFYKVAYQAGLKTVAQLLNPNGNWTEVDLVCRTYSLTVMQYNSIVAAIPKAWKKFLKDRVAPDNLHENPKTKSDDFQSKSKCVALVYHKINEAAVNLEFKFNKWNESIDNFVDFDAFCESFNNIYKITKNTKLRSFQFRLLHNALVFNVRLFKAGVVRSYKCTFCGIEKENCKHFFLECHITRHFWSRLKKFLSKAEDNSPISYESADIILNTIHPTPKHCFNFITLVAKQYLYASRCQKKNPSFLVFERKIQTLQNYENYFAKKNLRLEQFQNVCKENMQPHEQQVYNVQSVEDFTINYVTNLLS